MSESSAPKEASAIYCLYCKERTPSDDVKEQKVSFKSKKEKKDCSRTTLSGTCSKCHRQVRKFVKGSAPAPEAPSAVPAQ